MHVTPLEHNLIPHVIQLLEHGEPYIRPRTYSDYWLYAEHFSSTCPVALDGDTIAGVVIAFRSQDNPTDVYIQDVMTHPDHRKQGVARLLLDSVRDRATQWGCTRIYLTSEPDNTAADATWKALGFTNSLGDHTVNVGEIADQLDNTRAVTERHYIKRRARNTKAATALDTIKTSTKAG